MDTINSNEADLGIDELRERLVESLKRDDMLDVAHIAMAIWSRQRMMSGKSPQ